MQLCKPAESLDVCLTRRHSELCAVFASPTRIEIMLLLGNEERTAGELASLLNITPANLSQHLRIMRDQQAVRSRRRGRHISYRIANPKFLRALQLVREGLREEIAAHHDAAQADASRAFSLSSPTRSSSHP